MENCNEKGMKEFYSEVAIGMKKNEAMKFLKAGKMNNKDSVLFREYGLTLRGDYALIRWTFVKWYVHYEDINWVMQYVYKMIEDDKPVAFIQASEWIEECQEWYFNDEECELQKHVWLRRNIEFSKEAA